MFQLIIQILIGDEQVTFSGLNLPLNLDVIYLGEKLINVITSTSTSITIKSPEMNPGNYNLVIPIGNNFGNVQ